MKYRLIGKTGLIVSELCLGTMVFGEKSGRGADERTSRAMIDCFIAAGGNFIDTADAYAAGESERIVGEAMRGGREQLVVSTKIGLPTGEGPNDAGLTRKHFICGVDASLRRMRTDYIDILFLHAHDPLTPTIEWLEAAERLISAGKILYLGVCNQFSWCLAEAATLARVNKLPRVVCAQYQYSPICRFIEDEYFDLFAAFGISLIPWSPLGGGFLSGKYQSHLYSHALIGRIDAAPSLEDNRDSRVTGWTVATLDAISEVARKHSATSAQVTLAWILSRICVASVAIGTRTIEQLTENMGAVELVLDADDLRAIDSASRRDQHYPYDFMRKVRIGERSKFARRISERVGHAPTGGTDGIF